MKKFTKKLLTTAMVATLALSAFGIAGCSLFENNDSSSNNDYVPVNAVLLEKESTTLEVGQDETLVVYVDLDATNKEVTWSSSDPAVATVDANGKVVAVGVGTATITVTSVDGGKTDTLTVTVNPKAGEVLATIQGLDATGAVSATDTLTFRDDGTYSVFAMFLGAVEVVQNSTYTVSDGVLTVAKPEPIVNTVFGGFETETLIEVYGNTVKFQVWSENDTGPICLGNYVIDEATATTLGITVGEEIEEVKVTGITLKQDTITVNSGSVANFDEIVEIAPANATNKNYTVAVKLDLSGSLMQDNGLKGVKAGTATVTITTADGGFTADCTVNVTYPEKTLVGENYFANDTAFAGALDLSAFGGSKMEKLYICKADGMVEIYDNYKLVQFGYYTLTGEAGNYTKIDFQRFSDGDGSSVVTVAENKMSFDAGNAMLPLVMTECDYNTAAKFDTQKSFSGLVFGFKSKTFTFKTDGTVQDESGQNGTYSLTVVNGVITSLAMNLETDGEVVSAVSITNGVYSFELFGSVMTENVEDSGNTGAATYFKEEKSFSGTIVVIAGVIEVDKTFTFKTDGTVQDESGQNGTYSLTVVDGVITSLTMNLENDGEVVSDVSITDGIYSFTISGSVMTEVVA